MSSLEQRREDPGRREVYRGGSQTHPGWAVFFLGWFGGIFMSLAFVAFVRWQMGWDRRGMFFVTLVITVALFFFGGKKAEGLTDLEGWRRWYKR